MTVHKHIKEMTCDACGRSMNPRGEDAITGHSSYIDLKELPTPMKWQKAFLEVYPETAAHWCEGVLGFDICYVCYWKAMGIKFKPIPIPILKPKKGKSNEKKTIKKTKKTSTKRTRN